MYDSNITISTEVYTNPPLMINNWWLLNSRSNLRIAIDGEAATGKTTIAKRLSEELNIPFLITGELYRILTLYLIKNHELTLDEKKILAYLKDLKIEIVNNKIKTNFKFEKEELISDKVNKNVSFISSLKVVRKFLLKVQKEYAKKSRVIIEGRDIGTVIMPNANFKFYLTANVDVAALRRFEQTANEKTLENSKETLNEIKDNIVSRNEIDSSRIINPLKKASDAIVIDTSYYSVEEIVKKILNIINNQGESVD